MHKCSDGTTPRMQQVEQCRSNCRGCHVAAMEVTNAGIQSRIMGPGLRRDDVSFSSEFSTRPSFRRTPESNHALWVPACAGMTLVSPVSFQLDRHSGEPGIQSRIMDPGLDDVGGSHRLFISPPLPHGCVAINLLALYSAARSSALAESDTPLCRRVTANRTRQRTRPLPRGRLNQW